MTSYTYLSDLLQWIHQMQSEAAHPLEKIKILDLISPWKLDRDERKGYNFLPKRGLRSSGGVVLSPPDGKKRECKLSNVPNKRLFAAKKWILSYQSSLHFAEFKFFKHIFMEAATSNSIYEKTTERVEPTSPDLLTLNEDYFFILLTHKGSHWKVYREFQPSFDIFSMSGAQRCLDHRFCAIFQLFLVGAPPSWFDLLGAGEAHQLGVGGIVRATGPDPFGNCMLLPRLLLGALYELPGISFAIVKDHCNGDFY